MGCYLILQTINTLFVMIGVNPPSLIQGCMIFLLVLVFAFLIHVFLVLKDYILKDLARIAKVHLGQRGDDVQGVK